ncbi:MAG: glycoside hydrolase family 5 protein [Thermoguttaceae bacterium]
MKKTVLVLSFFVLFIFASFSQGAELPKASWNKLPKWYGFNLLEKFNVGNNKPFEENDFKWISEFGFNFVRLPMDYRCWIKDGDWEKFDEKTLKEIDQAVEYGKKYNVHVNLNFHRAPGYTVASPPEKTDLWTDAKTQEVCAKHWALFAKRYKGIPNEQLSFNLFNEPSDGNVDKYVEVAKKIIDAIRAEDPDRLIILDGAAWGLKPFIEAKDLNVALSSRGYSPFELTHYKAGWVNGADKFPVPTWPIQSANGLIFGTSKPQQQKPLVINGPFTVDTTLTLRLYQVSTKAELYVKADDKTIFEKTFEPKDGTGEWSKVVYMPQWKCYQNIYDKDYECTIPAGTHKVEIGVLDGDWASLSKLELTPKAGKKTQIDLLPDWNADTTELAYDTTNGKISGGIVKDRKFLMDTVVKPWVDIEKQGVGVMIGEFGVFNQTPHDVSLEWMEDCLKNWQDVGFGWSLWNFRGGIGVMDSQRKDVEYEDFHGHKLDREMMNILQKYAK